MVHIHNFLQRIKSMGFLAMVLLMTHTIIYSGQVLVDSKSHFLVQINEYNDKIERETFSVLNRHALQGNVDAKEIVYLYDNLSESLSVKGAITLLTRALDIRDRLETNNLKAFLSQDKIYMPILLQSSFVLVKNCRLELFSILDTLNSSLRYWRAQKNSPTKYFFGKSPAKWFTGKSQTEEVAYNIKKLEKLDNNIRSLLGKMTYFLYTFDVKASIDKQLVWIDDLIKLLYFIGKGDKSDSQDNCSLVMGEVRDKLRRIVNFSNRMIAQTDYMKKPGHFARNWLYYSAALASTYYAYTYYSANQEMVKGALQRSLESVTKSGQEYFIDPIKEAWQLIFYRNSATEESNKIFKESKKAVQLLSPEITGLKKDLLAALNTGEKDIREKSIDRLTELLNRPVEKGWFYNGVSVDKSRAEEIIKAIENDNTDPLNELFNSIDVRYHSNLKIEVIKILLPLELVSKRTMNVLNLVGLIGGKSAEFIDILVQVSNEVLALFDQSRKASDLTLKLLALIPVAGLLWSSAKGYNMLMARDYSMIRLSLIEINSLFIESKSPLNDAAYGKLIYLLESLKKKATRYLPTKNNVQADFLSDLAKLESQEFDIEIKRRIVENMFRKYSFLSLNAKSA